jgi:hypothetical protein
MINDIFFETIYSNGENNNNFNNQKNLENYQDIINVQNKNEIFNCLVMIFQRIDNQLPWYVFKLRGQPVVTNAVAALALMKGRGSIFFNGARFDRSEFVNEARSLIEIEMKIFSRAFENASIIDFESYVYRSKIAIMQRQLKMSVLRASLASGKSGLLVSRAFVDHSGSYPHELK